MDPTQSVPERGRKLPRRDDVRPEERDAPLVEDGPVVRPVAGPASMPDLDSGRAIKHQPSDQELPGVQVP